jgi:hypothetical protein
MTTRQTARAGALRAALWGQLATLNEDELDVVADVVGGLRKGHQVYGDLNLATDTRDFDGEALEELRDAMTYRAMARVRRARASGGAR